MQQPIESIPATSILTLRKLKSLGIKTYFDLLNYFPFRYENYSVVSVIKDLQEGEEVTIKGRIMEVRNIYTRRRLSIQKLRIEDETDKIDLTWFNQPFLLKFFKKGEYLSIAGRVKKVSSRLTLEPKEYEVLKNNNQETIHTGRIIPIYPEKRGLSSKTIREKEFRLLQEERNLPDEILPKEILTSNDLMDEKEAYVNVHFPKNSALLQKARERLSFDELFTIQLSNYLVRKDWEKEKVGYKFAVDKFQKEINDFIKKLPFILTDSQKKVLEEILGDLKKDKPMNRFLQGDVGSGKTVVATIGCYLSLLNRLSSLFMAPTEILAAQHYHTISWLLDAVQDIKVCLLTSSSRPSKEELESADIIIGTHALIRRGAKFDKVGFVVIDEQHRFGVRQRALLKSKGLNPHLLTMTATPIPRTVSLTMYGELDLSLITQMPKGRTPVKTYLVPKEKREKAYAWIKEKVLKDRIQVFIVCPLIEESEKETMRSVKAAKKEHDHLSKKVFRNFKMGLLHGKIKGQEKNQIMKDFKDKKFDILLSTPVVEVGVDIPNATIMLIEGAERYGLAQLHQLRGRVGRSDKQSYCLLFTSSADKLDGQKVKDRLEFFAKTSSGIELAEYDLKTRGPGEMYGTKQHGIPDLKIASFSNLPLIQRTRNAVLYFTGKYKISDFPEIKRRVSEYKIEEIAHD